MQSIKEFAPLIKRVITVNTILALYYLMPNFSSFLATAVIFILIFKIKPCCSAQQGDGMTIDVNAAFNSYLKGQAIKKLIVIVILGLFVRITYMLPSWLLIFIMVQMYGFSQLLVQFGCVEMLVGGLSRMEQSVKKIVNMIPRYDQVQKN